MAQAASEKRGGTSRLRRWFEYLNRSENSLWMLLVASFVQTLIMVPMEPVLIPYMMANRGRRMWWAALMVVLGVTAAGVGGYWLGYYLFESFGRSLIETMGWQDSYKSFREMFNAHAFWAITVNGLTPIPFWVAMLFTGAVGYSFLMFTLATILSHSIRFFGVGLVVWKFGDEAEEFWHRHRLTAMAVILLIIGIAFGVSFWLGE